MAKFIEVAPINYGAGKKKMLINVEKIDYVEEEKPDGSVTTIHLSNVPIDYFGENDLFPRSLHVADPYIFISDEIARANEVK